MRIYEKREFWAEIFIIAKKTTRNFLSPRTLQKQAVSLAHITKRKINAFKSLLKFSHKDDCSLKTLNLTLKFIKFIAA